MKKILILLSIIPALIIGMALDIHWLLLRIMTYRWMFNSLAYPFTKRKIRRLYRLKTKDEAIMAWSNFERSNHWSKKYWFGKKLSEYVLINFCN